MGYDAVDGYLAAAETTASLLAESAVADRWDQPSALQHWSVAGLAGHLARGVLTLPAALAATEGETAPMPSDAVGYYSAAPDEDSDPESEIARRIRDRGVETAGSGVADLLGRYTAAVDDARLLVRRTPATRLVTVFGRTLSLREWLRTRTVEMVVHADDLAFSVGCVSPAFPAPVCEDVISILAVVASRRRGSHALVRALARSERAHGQVSAF